jgi:hypothetical protein
MNNFVKKKQLNTKIDWCFKKQNHLEPLYEVNLKHVVRTY